MQGTEILIYKTAYEQVDMQYSYQILKLSQKNV